jgi:hypothetical protein
MAELLDHDPIKSRVRIDQAWFGRSGGLAPISLPLFRGRATGDGGAAVFVKHVRAPRFLRASSMLSDAQIVSAFRDLQS